MNNMRKSKEMSTIETSLKDQVSVLYYIEAYENVIFVGKKWEIISNFIWFNPMVFSCHNA